MGCRAAGWSFCSSGVEPIRVDSSQQPAPEGGDPRRPCGASLHRDEGEPRAAPRLAGDCDGADGVRQVRCVEEEGLRTRPHPSVKFVGPADPSLIEEAGAFVQVLKLVCGHQLVLRLWPSIEEAPSYRHDRRGTEAAPDPELSQFRQALQMQGAGKPLHTGSGLTRPERLA